MPAGSEGGHLDNVTHSLFGYALARALPASVASSPQKRRALVFTSVLASNVPDADFVIGMLAHDEKLAYLLHHRGHTHTLALALPLGLLVAALCAGLARVRVPRDRLHVALLGVLACALHIGFDAFNNYGVHPFFPVDDRWYYGDFVFIIEPLLLAVMFPLLAHGAETRWGRVLGWLLSAGLAALLFAASALVPTGFAATLVAVLVLCLIAGRVVRIDGRGTLLAVTAVVVIFLVTSRVAKTQIGAELARQVPAERLLDLSTSPFPGNPLCWSALAVTRDESAVYRARYVYLTLAPAWLSADACRVLPRGPTTAPLRAQTLRDSRAFAFGGLFEGKASELRELAKRSCQAEALLRFVRVPYWTRDGQRTVLGDLRYDSAEGLEFAEMYVGDPCRDFIPAWVPPRADLLR
jgi:inner membrane protein